MVDGLISTASNVDKIWARPWLQIYLTAELLETIFSIQTITAKSRQSSFSFFYQFDWRLWLDALDYILASLSDAWQFPLPAISRLSHSKLDYFSEFHFQQ